MSTTITHRQMAAHRMVREVGLTGAVVVSWTSAGGIVVGGVWPAFFGASAETPSAIWLDSSVRFFVGALIGLLHGAFLGVVGRRHWKSVPEAWTAVGISSMYTLPAVAALWGVAGVVAMTETLWARGALGPTVAVASGWIIAAAVTVTAAVQGTRAIVTAFRRWPEWRLGATATLLSLIALIAELVSPGPRVLWNRISLPADALVLLAIVIVTWFVGPGVTLGLRRRARLVHPPSLTLAGDAGMRAVGLMAAAAGGVLMAASVLLFHGPPSFVPTFADGVDLPHAIVRGVGEVVILGVVFRLAIVTTILERLSRRSIALAAIGAIVGAAVIETLANLPGVLSLGMPHAATTAGFLAATATAPALILGYLYLRFGWVASLLAHGTCQALVIALGAWVR